LADAAAGAPTRRCALVDLYRRKPGTIALLHSLTDARASDDGQTLRGVMAATETPRTLRQVEQSLRTILGNDAMFSLVNTRLMLRTGVDLKGIDPAQDSRSELLKQVIQALEKMGYSFTTNRSGS
jgi:hypothetical protein